MTTDNFTEAARAEAERRNPSNAPKGLTRASNAISRRDFRDGAEWARTHLAAQRAEEVRDWAVQQYPSGTPLDQDRRMVAAETEAYLSGRSERDMSDLAQAAKHAGPVDPPAQEPTDAEVEAAANAIIALVPGETEETAHMDDIDDAWDHARAALTAACAARRDEEKR